MKNLHTFAITVLTYYIYMIVTLTMMAIFGFTLYFVGLGINYLFS